MLAALNNPHIATIHDVIDVGDHRAIVMELVAGPTLTEVIARGPVSLRTALGYAIDVCEALGAAHAAGIVHRDLKPANVVITESGSAKVLDFGLAKPEPVDEATALEQSTVGAVTQENVIVGTPGYLSPEQAHGRPVDARSDIFSLGVVLHEIISGRPAFRGDSTAALLSAVLRDNPPLLRTLVPSTPHAIERLVARCLEKEPQSRYQSAIDLKAALEDVREDLAIPALTANAEAGLTAASPTAARSLRPRAVVYGVAGAAIAVAAFIAADAFRSDRAFSPTYRSFITEAVQTGTPAWSPDGRTLAYIATISGQMQIFLRHIDAAQSTQVTKQGTDGVSLFWSPDGTRIYFTRAGDGNLVSVGAGGGEPQPVRPAPQERTADPTYRLAGGGKSCISPDGRSIVFTRRDSGGAHLSAMDVPTGTMRALEPIGLPQTLANVQALAFSPDGTSIAMIASTTALNDARGVWIIPWPIGSARHLFGDAPYLAANPSISWFPDSRRFVMNAYPLRGGTNRLLVADIRAGTLSPLTGGKDDEVSPSVTPDGARIAFVSQRSGRWT